MSRKVIFTGLFVIFALCLPFLAKAVQAALAVQEVLLNPTGAPYEIHADSAGNLWISDYDAGEIWRVNSTGTGTTIFSVGGNPSDAHPDNQGGLWWVDMTYINRLDITTGNTQTWDAAGSGWLYGLAVDSLDRIWLADSDMTLPNLYRFDLANNRELCTFPLPDSGQGYYPSTVGSQAWLGDVANGRLVRLDGTQFDWWALPAGSFPQDLDIDAAGNVWYADPTLGQIGRLVPATDTLTVFPLPSNYAPAMLALSGGKIWYSENTQGTVGVLDPLLAASSNPEISTGSAGVTPSCTSLARPSTGKPKDTPGIPGWSSASYDTLVDAGGWKIYQFPLDASPAGIVVTDYAWVVDTGRSKLVKLPFTDLSLKAEKKADPAIIPETGGEVTFTFKVTNTSGHEDLQITSLADSAFGSLEGDADCMVGTSLAPGAFCEFSIIKSIEGNYSGPSHTNTFTVHAENLEHFDVSASGEASVAFTNVMPSIEVSKAADPSSISELGGFVTFTFTIKNTSSKEAVTITSLSDSVFDPVAGETGCQVTTQLATGASCSFSLVRWLQGNYAGPSHTNTFTAQTVDDDQSMASDTAVATVLFTDVLPQVAVSKTANPDKVPETGGNVTFTFSVTNTGLENVTLTSLVDDRFGNLNSLGTCVTPQSILVNSSYSCTYTVTLASDNLAPHTNSVTATAVDNDQTQIITQAAATVGFSNVLPSILVTKTANPTSVPDAGGDVTFTFTVQNTSSEEAVTIQGLSDSIFGSLVGDDNCAVNTVLSAGASCEFSIVRKVAKLDTGNTHTNVFTATAVDNDGSTAADDDDATVTFTGSQDTFFVYLPMVRR